LSLDSGRRERDKGRKGPFHQGRSNRPSIPPGVQDQRSRLPDCSSSRNRFSFSLGFPCLTSQSQFRHPRLCTPVGSSNLPHKRKWLGSQNTPSTPSYSNSKPKRALKSESQILSAWSRPEGRGKQEGTSSDRQLTKRG